MKQTSILYFKKFKSLIKKNINGHLYNYRLSKLRLKKNNIVYLGTLPRSGTHLMQILLANAIVLKLKEKRKKNETLNFPVDLKKTSKLMPNNWYTSYFNYKKFGLKSITGLNYIKTNRYFGDKISDITRTHSFYLPEFFNGSKVIHLRRNPLDFFTSIFFYKYKKRGNTKLSSPYEVYIEYRDYYINLINSYDEAQRKCKSNIFSTSYENLILNKGDVLHQILLFLDIDLAIDKCNQAADASSIQKVKKHENSGQKVNPTANDLKGSFINSGSIGEWQKYFNEQKFSEVKKYFKRYDLDLENFHLY